MYGLRAGVSAHRLNIVLATKLRTDFLNFGVLTIFSSKAVHRADEKSSVLKRWWREG
jgi:alkanesulfonate monooxygenase SsuD/methylene tetrahydromethanopterin reductase-like flavin-dependent oxidoreductase (luciferase family)